MVDALFLSRTFFFCLFVRNTGLRDLALKEPYVLLSYGIDYSIIYINMHGYSQRKRLAHACGTCKPVFMSRFIADYVNGRLTRLTHLI